MNKLQEKISLSFFPNLVDLLIHRATYQGKLQAYTFLVNGEHESKSWTFENLDQKARCIAAYLQTQNLAPGERALLLYPPGLEFIAAFFGCLYAGVIAVPAYPPRPNQSLHRLQSIAANAEVAVALSTTSAIENQKAQFSQLMGKNSSKYIATDVLDLSLAESWNPHAIESETLALLQYTSGSTGTPKGVMITHENLLQNLMQICKCFGHTQESKGVIWLPSYHDMGLIGGVLQPLFVGFPVVLMSPVSFLQKPIRWLNAISNYRATTSGGPNFAYDLCIERIKPEDLTGLDLSSWQVAFNGAEGVRAETLELFAAKFAPFGFSKKIFYPCYGLAEATLLVTGGKVDQSPQIRSVQAKALEHHQILTAAEGNGRQLVASGYTWLGQQLRVIDPETLKECPPEQVGEIWISGPHVAQGYWNNPELTKQFFQAQLADFENEAFLRTGDLGFLDDTGELYVTGRLKDIIIIRGRNYYPQDIEQTVEQSHPALSSHGCAAFSVDVRTEEQLVIVVEVKRESLRNLDVEKIVKAIRQAVFEEHELQVTKIALLKTATIPRTSSGKIQHYVCRAKFLDETLDIAGTSFEYPEQINTSQVLSEADGLWQMHQRNERGSNDNKELGDITEQDRQFPTQHEIETWLVSRLAISLNILPEQIEKQESFAAYGLDSSIAISITEDLAEWLGCELEPILFWEYPSPMEVAEYLTSEFSNSVFNSSALITPLKF